MLNTPRFQEIQVKNGECGWYEAQFNFDPICMRNLKDIVEDFDAHIVISSTWRYHCKDNSRHWVELLGNLNQYGLKDRVTGITPGCSRHDSKLCRGDDIKEWLRNHDDVNKFVIIDDDSDMLDLIYKLAKCNYKTGLTNEVKEKCYEILSSD